MTEKAKKKAQLREEEEQQGLEPGTLTDSLQKGCPEPEEGGDRQNTMMLIEWDLPRTFPTLRFFHDGQFYPLTNSYFHQVDRYMSHLIVS